MGKITLPVWYQRRYRLCARSFRSRFCSLPLPLTAIVSSNQVLALPFALHPLSFFLLQWESLRYTTRRISLCGEGTGRKCFYNRLSISFSFLPPSCRCLSFLSLYSPPSRLGTCACRTSMSISFFSIPNCEPLSHRSIPPRHKKTEKKSSVKCPCFDTFRDFAISLNF